MTSPYRIPVHQFDTTDASDVNDTPRYDPATNTVKWSAAAVSFLVAGPGVSIDRTDPSRPFISLSDNVQSENTTPTGVMTISGTPVTTESVVPGMDLSPLVPGEPTQIAVNLWISMYQPGTTKGSTARLYDGDPATGTLIASQVFPDVGDSTAGHASQWVYTGEHVMVTDRLCVTVQATTGAPTVYSDSRYFTATQNFGRRLADMTDVDLETTPPTDGDTITYDQATDTWGPAGNERIVVVAAGVTTLPPGSPGNALVLRRLP